MCPRGICYNAFFTDDRSQNVINWFRFLWMKIYFLIFEVRFVESNDSCPDPQHVVKTLNVWGKQSWNQHALYVERMAYVI